MMILDSTTKSLNLVLGAAKTTNDLSFVAHYVDITSIGFTSIASDGLTSGITAITLVPPPPASTQRQVKYISIFNGDTISTSVSVRINNNGVLRGIVKVLLDPNDTLSYSDSNAWSVLDGSGRIKSWAEVSFPFDITNASNLTSGTLNYSVIPSNVTLKGNSFNGAGQLLNLDVNGKLPALDGSNLTGSVTQKGNSFNNPNQLLLLDNNGKLPAIDGSNLTGTVTQKGNVFNGANQLVNLDSFGRLPAVDGSQLTGVVGAGGGATVYTYVGDTPATATPPSNVGVNGDLMINEYQGDIYVKKNGVWNLYGANAYFIQGIVVPQVPTPPTVGQILSADVIDVTTGRMGWVYKHPFELDSRLLFRANDFFTLDKWFIRNTSSIFLASETNHPGILRLSSQTNVQGSISVADNSLTNGTFNINNNFEGSWIVKLQGDVSDYKLYIGFMQDSVDSSLAPVGVYFKRDISGVLSCCINGSCQTTAYSSLFYGDWVKLGIKKVLQAGNQITVRFLVNGLESALITTTFTSVNLQTCISMVAPASSSRYIDIDYISVAVKDLVR